MIDQHPLPLRPGDHGDGVRDVQRRLSGVGQSIADAHLGVYDDATVRAVRAFQESRGLEADGICGRQTWAALVEADHRLGDRLLYLHRPLLRGDDVVDLQRRLGGLGFDAGRVDGIFGPDTERATKDFQRNSALTVDGVAGRDTVTALRRLGGEPQSASVRGVREVEHLRSSPPQLEGCRLVLADSGGLSALCANSARRLRTRGAVVAVVDHPDESEQAAEANAFEAEVFIRVEVVADPCCRAAFFESPGYTSPGGRQLATLAAEQLGPLLETPGRAVGMRLPALRETRMPAMVCRLGPTERVVQAGEQLAVALAQTIEAWVETPVG